MSCRLPLPVALLALTIVGSLALDDSTVLSTTSVPSSSTSPGAVAPTGSESTSNPATSTPSVQSSTSAPDPSLQWVVLHAENPSGLLQDRVTGCTDFAFAGVQCSLSFTYQITTSPSDLVVEHTDTFSYGNSGDNPKLYSTPLSGNAFEGFELIGTLNGNNNTIATFNYTVPNNQPQGIITLTDPATGAAVKIAWLSGLQPPVTTLPPTTQPSTTLAETETTSNPASEISPGTTPAPTTPAPFYPTDCDDFTGAGRTNEAKTIYIGGDSKNNISVYCEFGTSGALTTIQSRGNKDNTPFSDDIDDYNTSFGTPGKGNNFWFGLDNMNAITANASYNLYVEVCCGENSTQQRYHSFTIGTAPNYTLYATADTPGIGLDLVAIAQTGIADIGAPFTTKKNYKDVTGVDPDECEALTTYDPDFDHIIATGTGGWWFGSCANNLNGQYIRNDELSTSCNMDDPSNTTGVALRTTSGLIDLKAQTYLDHKSYTRVRMAIYKGTLQGISTTDFCMESRLSSFGASWQDAASGQCAPPAYSSHGGTCPPVRCDCGRQCLFSLFFFSMFAFSPSYPVEMSRTKVQQQTEHAYKPVEFYAGTEPAEWNDMLRGILVALVGQHPVLWNFRTAKDKILEVLSGEVATVLQNTDAKMNVWAVLEKWCWMMEMYARSVEFRFPWRYTNSMNYLANSPASSLGAYLCCLTNDRFVELTKKYATTQEEHAAKEFALTGKKCRKVGLGFSMFAEEMSLYAEIVKRPTPAPIAVVVSSADGTPVQLLASTSPAGFLLQPTVSQHSDMPTRARRGRSAAKYGTRSRVASSTQEMSLPTSVSDILNSLATSAAATSAVASTSSPAIASSPPATTAKEEDSTRTAKVKEEVVEIKDEDPSGGDLTLALIDAVKDRPEIWDHNAFLTPDRCRLWKEVVNKMRRLPNSESVNEANIVFSWRQLVEYVRSPPLDQLSDVAKKHLEKVRERMQFLLEPAKQSLGENGMGIFTAANNGAGLHANDIQAQIQKIFGKLNSAELSPRQNQHPAAKRPCISSPGMRDAKRNVDSPQVVTTWVPPKEDALANAFAAVAAANPTATAQIMTQDNHPFSGLFTIDTGFAKGTKRDSHTNGTKRGSSHLDSKEDKWSLLGRLVEQTCRELETKDMETAVHLQRELSEVLCKYQLATLRKS